MLAQVSSCAVVGLDGEIVQVEVDISQGLPSFAIVGLPDTAVQEAKERVRSAVRNSGHEFPLRRITVNLAPADLRKEGPSYDLPIAVGILVASGQVPASENGAVFLGELSLDGHLRHTNGVLPMVALARDRGYAAVFVPSPDASEAALIDGIQVVPVSALGELASHMRQTQPIAPFVPTGAPSPLSTEEEYEAGLVDFRHIRGQEHVKRALEVAAAGGHNVVMSGPPGAGKTLLTRALPAILPALASAEALEVTKIYSVAGMLPQETPMVHRRPFRAPHHSISHAGLVGGGRQPRPGEITLSHRGVLFLDELPEFSRRVLETLRQPLEQGTVLVSRAARSVSFPAQVMLVGAMNPCPCGYHGSDQRICRCPPPAVERYWRRLSGPLRDRFDLGVELPAVPWRDLQARATGESSAEVRPRVLAARERQLARQQCLNGRLDGRALQRHGRPADSSTEVLLGRAVTRLRLSVRGVSRVLRVARTISDLEGSPGVERRHVAEALQFRLPDPAVSAVNA
jgi:magnesium chelatase family protein